MLGRYPDLRLRLESRDYGVRPLEPPPIELASLFVSTRFLYRIATAVFGPLALLPFCLLIEIGLAGLLPFSSRLVSCDGWNSPIDLRLFFL